MERIVVTLAEQIIKWKTNKTNVLPSEILMVKPDKIMIHDIFIPFVVEKFYEMGFEKVFDPDRIVIIFDHLVPAAKAEDIRHFKIAHEFIEKQGIKNVHESDGICHQLMHEQGYVKPGDIVFGTDSHTVTYGALGVFSSGLGYTDIASIIGTGETWIKVPETIRIKIDGSLPKGVYAKDVILKIIGDIGADGASYKAIEFVGSTVEAMSISSRLTMSNMVVEAGAKVGLFYPDEKTCRYADVSNDILTKFQLEDSASTIKVLEYKAEEFVPVAAIPSNVDNVKAIKELDEIKVDQVFIGSCTNGRLEDLEVAASILQGKRISKNVKLVVTPASREVYEMAATNGYLETFVKAGAIITHPGCGLCCGRGGGIVGDNEVLVATNNRNFLGRMGSESSKTYLVSPAVAALSAIKGFLTYE
ncbi:aconitase/3-isopropylmalate dehydratase large subunit family protein [Anaeromicropila populeti]|uniref:aconitase/3-isopropylmalate dehydratase large subunit family protein n=1 Tax=Anaeromicropila populeti TaxID=37658 RepID=UPI002E8E165D|nr:aconitase/3-isopropylmalate dehydratase large subunit family protein [Anaeromicropila populeti]